MPSFVFRTNYTRIDLSVGYMRKTSGKDLISECIETIRLTPVFGKEFP